MEILSSQVGQNFANVSNEQAKSRNDVTPVSTDAVAEQSANNKNAVQEIQVKQESADNSNSERESSADLAQAVQDIESFLQVQNRNLAFSVDDDTKRAVVTVKDSSSGDVIRQIPSEEVLRLAERIKDLQEDVGSSVGVLLNKQV